MQKILRLKLNIFTLQPKMILGCVFALVCSISCIPAAEAIPIKKGGDALCQ